MNNVIYGNWSDVKILKQGTYCNYNFVIVSYGTHPCAYVEILKNHLYYNRCEEDIDIDVHYGITYAENGGVFSLRNINDMYDNGFWIGWDYAHCNDFIYGSRYNFTGKKYSISEIYDDVVSVITQLIEKQEQIPSLFKKSEIFNIRPPKRNEEQVGMRAYNKGYNQAIDNFLYNIERLEKE